MNNPIIKIAIATNINFYEKSLKIILPSLMFNGITPDMIHVFNAGFDIDEKEVVEGVTYYKLSHNSYEYSPLIEIVEKEIESDYWFLLHDTCKVGLNFKNLLYKNIENRNPDKIALTQRPSMSMGLYSYKYLLSVKDLLIKIKNKDYSHESMQKWKDWGVYNEDYILWNNSPAELPNDNHRMNYITDENWYGTPTHRRTEYFGGFDIYKNKSNWGQTKKGFMTISI